MLDRVFPQRLDNTYSGSKLALWLFALIVLMRLGISLNSIFNGSVVASSADWIPLDTFTPAAARTVVSLFGLLGLSHLVICLLCILVLVRYRALVPFMFALLLLQQLGRKLVLYFLPVPRTGTPPGSVINLVLLGLMLAGLVLSLWNRDNLQTRE